MRRQPYGKCRSRLSAANQHASKGNRKGRVAVQPGGFGGQKLCKECRLKYFSERGEGISGRRRSLRCLWLLTPKTKKVMGCSPTLVKLASRYFSVSSLFQTSWLWLPIFQPQSRAFKKKKPNAVILLISARCWNLGSKIASTGKQAKSKGQWCCNLADFFPQQSSFSVNDDKSYPYKTDLRLSLHWKPLSVEPHWFKQWHFYSCFLFLLNP